MNYFHAMEYWATLNSNATLAFTAREGRLQFSAERQKSMLQKYVEQSPTCIKTPTQVPGVCGHLSPSLSP